MKDNKSSFKYRGGRDSHVIPDDPAVLEIISILGSMASILALVAETRRHHKKRSISRLFGKLVQKVLDLQVGFNDMIDRMDKHQRYSDYPIIENPSDFSGTSALLKPIDYRALRRNQEYLYKVKGEIREVLAEVRRAVDELNDPLADRVLNKEVFNPFNSLLRDIGNVTFGEYCLQLDEKLTELHRILIDISRGHQD